MNDAREASAAVPPEPARRSGSPVTPRLERILAGDGDARRWLYETFAARLFRRLHLRYAARPGIDADEIFQDAFVAFFQRDSRVLARFIERVPEAERTEARLEGYLWDVACGIASNRRRSARRHRDVPLLDADAQPDPLDFEQQTVDRDTLLRLIGCLKHAGSRVFLYAQLRYVDGLSPEEIARVTGWSRKATYKLKLILHEAVERCAERLRLS
ncbi:MAG TPA: sigma-70 family RNA polymerase sigma factor [Candidatus Polarisedimenticolaceae bacterium]|nr:sigma-70 family RNA polymerase sigma factor [Candidatus Polarisedimenticolaceae bacterium]